MSTTTETYWDVDGESLQTYAFNITTLGGDRDSARTLRGDDIQVPFRRGSIWMPKVVDSHVITLGMWVIGADEDGNAPADMLARRQYEQNWRKIRKLLFTPRRQFTLTKRFWVLEDDLVAAGVAVDDLPREGIFRLMTASAKGSYAGGLVPTMNGPVRGVFTVDIKLADPFFYSAPITRNFTLTSSTAQTITVLGDERTTAIGVTFTGLLNGPKLENETAGVWCRYNAAIESSASVTLDVDDFEASYVPTGPSGQHVAGLIEHDGDPYWMVLDPGENDLKFTALGGSGTAQLSYQPGWF